MGGGLIQLIQPNKFFELHLSQFPEMHFYKVQHKRHQNFSMEAIEIPIDNAKPNGRVSVQMLRNGDFLSKSYLKISIPKLIPTNLGNGWTGSIAWVKRLGHAIINCVDVQIGGESIDKHWGIWLDIWYELTHKSEDENGYMKMIGDIPELTTLSKDGVQNGDTCLYIPFQFWYCQGLENALPLAALDCHEVRINIEFTSIDKLIVYTSDVVNQCPKFDGFWYGDTSILADYIYVDTDDIKRIRSETDYLIDQIQMNQQSLNYGINQSFNLYFNGLCKEIIWTHKLGAFNGSCGYSYLGYTDNDDWKDVLDNVAKKLIVSSISINDTETITSSVIEASSVIEGCKMCSITLSGRISTGFNYQTNTSFQINNCTNNPISLYYYNNVFEIHTSILYDRMTNTEKIFNPMEKITHATVEVRELDGNIIYNVLNVQHKLTMNDISTPVQKFVDNRLNNTRMTDVFVIQSNNYGVGLDRRGIIVDNGNIICNGHDRFQRQSGEYFNYVLPRRHHTRTPADGINLYSFVPNPETSDTGGSYFFGDSTRLTYKVKDPFSLNRPNKSPFDIHTGTDVYIFARTFNILRIFNLNQYDGKWLGGAKLLSDYCDCYENNININKRYESYMLERDQVYYF